MGYLTYRIFRDVPLERLTQKVRANLDLYGPGTEGREVEVTAIEGAKCSALQMGCLKREEALLMPIGYQLGCVWMDVSYNDGDWWELRIWQGSEQVVGHNPNPWIHGERVKWEEQHFEYRINRVCEDWPDHADRIHNYLLPARRRVIKLGRTRFVPRTGKAYETDRFEYGDADQIYDFVAAFGISEQARSAVVKVT